MYEVGAAVCVSINLNSARDKENVKILIQIRNAMKFNELYNLIQYKPNLLPYIALLYISSNLLFIVLVLLLQLHFRVVIKSPDETQVLNCIKSIVGTF